MRYRITIEKSGDRSADLQLSTDLRRVLWPLPAVTLDSEYPLEGVHRDEAGRVYIEFATEQPKEIQQVLSERDYADRVEMTESKEPLGDPCMNCGNIAGRVRPSVCPNCFFRDISPCPACGQEVSRQSYIPLGADQFRCPRCRCKVRLRHNDPLVLLDGSFNQPLVLVDEASHEVR